MTNPNTDFAVTYEMIDAARKFFESQGYVSWGPHFVTKGQRAAVLVDEINLVDLIKATGPAILAASVTPNSILDALAAMKPDTGPALVDVNTLTPAGRAWFASLNKKGE